MSIDPRCLSRAYRRLSWQSSVDRFLEALSAPAGDYIIIAPRNYPDRRADLLVRSELTEQVLKHLPVGAAYRRKWERALRLEPGQLSGLMARRNGEQFQSLYFEDWLHHWGGSYESVPVIDIDSMPAESLPERCVIVRGSRTVGVFDEHNLFEANAWRSDENRYEIQNSGVKHIVERSSGSYSRSVVPRIYTAEKTTPPFIAHPRITPETAAYNEQVLYFAVGFSTSPDGDADQQQRIKIENALPGEKLMVFVSADGAAIEGEAMAELEIKMEAEYRFKVLPGAGLHELTLRASYMFRGKLVGAIVKTLTVEDPASASRSNPTVNAIPSLQKILPLADIGDIEPVDIVLWVQKEKKDHVAWMALDCNAGERFGPFSMSLENPQAFGDQLAYLCSQPGDDESTARAELRGMGKAITRLIPRDIREKVLIPILSDRKTPSILLLTDEPYMPWELASFGPDEVGADAPAYLGERAQMGRWWTAENSEGPVSHLSIKRISALAGNYTSGAVSPLKHAIQEAEMLRKQYQAKIIVAKKSQVDTWLDKEPRQPGHMAHVALHGYSDVLSSQQGLKLEDGVNIPPYRFAGDWYKNQIPRFSAVFLNACQVGTAGEQLGRMSGFPGAVIAGGASAFIAPLWAVKDHVALQVAQSFYESTSEGNQTVGETFRQIREKASVKGNITCLAYLFYGHPLLRMSWPKQKVKSGSK